MREEKKKEGLQTRREFFKKAAKSALPIVAAITLSGMPHIVKAMENASAVCDTCQGGCRYTCSKLCNSIIRRVRSIMHELWLMIAAMILIMVTVYAEMMEKSMRKRWICCSRREILFFSIRMYSRLLSRTCTTDRPFRVWQRIMCMRLYRLMMGTTYLMMRTVRNTDTLFWTG